MNVGEIIRRHREERGLSITDISKQTTIPENIILKIENDPEYIKTPHGRLHLKVILKQLNIEDKVNVPSETSTSKPTTGPKNYGFVRYIAHALIFTFMFVFIYANARYNSEKVEVSKGLNNQNQMLSKEDQQSEINNVKSLTLKSSGDVWITATIDGEKTIFNIKDGESKTINFQSKIAFETIGNVNQLVMVFGDQEVSFRDKEVIHNVFVDEEGIFYNGYNVLRGKPKI